ncbi:MAG: DUF4421 family protein [Bacteroidia bacterium]
MGLRIILCGLILSLFSAQSTAQDSAVVKKHKFQFSVHPDTNYVRDYSDFLSVDLPLASSYLNVDLTDKKTNKVLNFKPHSDMTAGLELGYKVVGLGYSVNTGVSHSSDKVYGKTDYSDLSFSFSSHRFVVDLYHEDFKGFYLNNYGSYPKSSPADTSKLYPQRSDMRAQSTGISINYIRNWNHFSYQAAFSNSEQQLKRCGSWLYGVYLSSFSLNSDSGLVTGKYKHYLTGYSNINYSNTFNAGLSIGYIYTLTIRHHWYITYSFNPGLSYLHYQSHASGPKDTLAGSKDSTYRVNVVANLGLRIQSRIAIGYNSPKWYAGVAFAGDTFYQDETVSKSNVAYTVGNAKFYIGYRFDAPALNRLWKKHVSGKRGTLDAKTSG